MSWCRQHIGSENRPYVVKGVKVHGQSIEWTHPPHRPASVLFFLMCPPPPLSLSRSFSPPLSFCITEYHCGAEIPSLTSPRLHNENKWAGSKYAGCVLFAALYQSAYRLSSKIKMDCVAEKAPNNAALCFIYPKQNFKGHFKRFNTYIHSH